MRAQILTTYAFGLKDDTGGRAKTQGKGADELRSELYQQALALQPELARANNNYAWVLVTSEEWDAKTKADEALVHVDRALEREPNESQYLDTKARALCLLGRFEDARRMDPWATRRSSLGSGA